MGKSVFQQKIPRHSFTLNCTQFQIKKEGESLEFKCRLEEDYEEGEVKMQWYFNDQEISGGDKYMITFDGTYATLFIASCVMDDMGEYKCVFENSAGRDETTGKVTVKPVSKNYFYFNLTIKGLP